MRLKWRFPISVMIGFALIVCVLLLGNEEPTLAASEQPIKVVVEGVEITLDVKPIMVNDHVMLHAKSVFDALKIASKFERNRVITATHNETVFKAEVNQTRVNMGKRNIRLAQSPLNQKGRIYVPVRFIAMVLDKEITYDPVKRQVNIGLTAMSKKALQHSLFEAARAGDATAIMNILKKGADPDEKWIEGYGDNTPLDYAVLNNHVEATRALLKGGAKLEAAGQSLGFRAILQQNAQLLDLILTAGLDPNTDDGETLLELAAGIISIGMNGAPSITQHPSLAVVDTLLRHGADPGIDNSLYKSVVAQNYSIIQALLRSGADPYKMNINGQTPYELSVQLHIHRWLTVQKERPLLPTFEVKDHEGRTMGEGELNIRSLDDPQSPVQTVQWRAGIVHADVISGNYEVLSVHTAGTLFLLQQHSRLAINNENVEPKAIELPMPNVSGTLIGDSVKIDGGSLILLDPRTSWISFAEVRGNQFSLYAPAGQYQIQAYRNSNGKFYIMDEPMTIANTASIQEITLHVKAPADESAK